MVMAWRKKSWPMRMAAEMRGYITNPHVSLELNDKGKLDVRGVVKEQTERLPSSKDLNMRTILWSYQRGPGTGMDFTYLAVLQNKLMELLGVSVPSQSR